MNLVDLQVLRNENPLLDALADKLDQFISQSNEFTIQFVFHNDEILILLDQFYPSTFLNTFANHFEATLDIAKIKFSISILNPLAQQLYFSLPAKLKSNATFHCTYFCEATIEYSQFQNLLSFPNLFLSHLRSSRLHYSGTLVIRHIDLPPLEKLDSKIIQAIENLELLPFVKHTKINALTHLLLFLDLPALTFMLRANGAKNFKHILMPDFADLKYFFQSGWWALKGLFQRWVHFPVKGLIQRIYGKIYVRLYWYIRTRMTKHDTRLSSEIFWSLYNFACKTNGTIRKLIVFTYWSVRGVAVKFFWQARKIVGTIAGRPIAYSVRSYWMLRRFSSFFYWKAYSATSRLTGEVFFLSGKFYGIVIRTYWQLIVPLSRKLFYPVFKIYYFSEYQLKQIKKRHLHEKSK